MRIPNNKTKRKTKKGGMLRFRSRPPIANEVVSLDDVIIGPNRNRYHLDTHPIVEIPNIPWWRRIFGNRNNISSVVPFDVQPVDVDEGNYPNYNNRNTPYPYPPNIYDDSELDRAMRQSIADEDDRRIREAQLREREELIEAQLIEAQLREAQLRREAVNETLPIYSYKKEQQAAFDNRRDTARKRLTSSQKPVVNKTEQQEAFEDRRATARKLRLKPSPKKGGKTRKNKKAKKQKKQTKRTKKH